MEQYIFNISPLAMVFHLVVEYCYSFASQNYNVCAHRWYMATSLIMFHVTTNKSRIYHLNLSIELSQESSLLFVSVLSIPSFWYYFKFNLGTLFGTCLGTSIIFNLHIIIIRMSVIKHESISGAEEVISFASSEKIC